MGAKRSSQRARFQELRREYQQHELSERSTHRNPFVQFERWFEDAIRSGIIEPNAMVLSTVSMRGQPSSRAVLLKSIEKGGFVFFTNYESRKGEELKRNRQVALLFLWKELERQVRIEGLARPLQREQSEMYFASRPREAQLAAFASPQSRRIRSREELLERYRLIEEQFKGKPVPCPPGWGGYVVVPRSFEFWQGRVNRMHDRIMYRKQGGRWGRSRLAP